MLLEIDEQSEQPIYQQLIDQIIVGIAKGELAPNESLPSIRQLADEIGVNMMTVSKAYNKLKQSGYIV
ncbi:GntR family transcriptional regulator, partial [Escherichia coli]